MIKLDEYDNSNTEIRLLRQELFSIRLKIDKDEESENIRLAELEREVREFKRKLAYGKGVFYGVTFMLGGLVWLLVDWMKEAIQHIGHAIK